MSLLFSQVACSVSCKLLQHALRHEAFQLRERGAMTRHSASVSSENPRPIRILRLQTDGLGRLCNSLETAGFLSGAPYTAGNPAKQAYLLDGLQHPKADKLIIYSPEEGPQLDLNVFKVKDLKILAACLQIPLKSTDKKADIILKISDNVAGNAIV